MPEHGSGGSPPRLAHSLLDLIAVSRDQPTFDIDFTSGPPSSALPRTCRSVPSPAPVHAWGTGDEVISPDVQDAYVEALCATGQPFEYRTYADKTDVGALDDPDSALPADLEQWTLDRLNAIPAEDTWARSSGVRSGFVPSFVPSVRPESAGTGRSPP